MPQLPALTSKVLIVDGETVLLGSTNWTAAAFQKNVEADLLVRSTETARELLQELDRNIPNPTPVAAPVLLLLLGRTWLRAPGPSR